MSKYAIGVDYGTESGRAVLVRLEDGKEVADHVTPYSNRVIDDRLPHKDIKLDHEWALQDPDDYLSVLYQSIPAVMEQSKVDPEDVIAIGIDFTSSTVLPIDKNGTPLCFDPSYRDNPHSWVKLWKHHAAQSYANKLNEIAQERNEQFLPRYGGRISSEWMVPKVWETLHEAPEVYEAADKYVEAADWIVLQLTGNLKRNSCTAGYKSIWHKQEGYPSKDFLSALDSKLHSLTETKLRGDIFPLGSRAGYITNDMAEKLGLHHHIAVAVGNIDAHVSVPGVGVAEPGKLVMTMGTSICHLLLSDKEVNVEGMCGVVEDGIVPGLFGYEAGQPAVGDSFAWYVENAVPSYIEKEANESGKSVHQVLEEKAAECKPGDSGLVALDWWNGNRSVLVDADLSGLIVGMTLQTKPEEIYRAMLESTAYGTRKIIEAFEKKGLDVDELYVCGGLPHKNKLLMQIYADVTNKTIYIADSVQTPAVGAAMFGSVAAGSENGGYDHIIEAAKKMGHVKDMVFHPNEENVTLYDRLYKEYDMLHDFFGRENTMMKRLKEMRTE